MLNSLIKIIQNTQIDEETAIEQVNLCLSEERDILTIDLDLSPSTPSTTPLIEAAKRGFFKLSERLMSAGFSADEMSQQLLTPLAAAISAKQLETAAYLILHTKNVAPSLLGHTVLHDLIENDLLRLMTPLLSMHPELLNQQTLEGETSLFIAARRGDLESVQALCAVGANPLTANIHGITPTAIAAINGHSAVLAFLLDQMRTCPISIDSIADQHHMLSMMLRNVKNDKKIKCLKQIIQAGAGLSPALLSDETLSLLRLKRSQLADFLMLVTETLPDQNTKELFICTEQQLIAVLNSSNRTVDIEKLIRACQHPLLKSNDKVQRIDTLLRKYTSESVHTTLPTPLLYSLADDENQPSVRSPEDMRLLNQPYLLEFLSHRLNLLDQLGNSISRKLSYLGQGFALCEPNIQDEGLERVFLRWLHVTHELVQSAHHSYTIMVTFNSQSLLTILHQEFDRIYDTLLVLFNHAKTNDSIIKYALLIDEKLRTLLKENGDALKYSNVGLYNSLWDAQALLAIKMARWHLDAGKHNEALALSLESLEFNEQMLINNPMLQMSAGHTKGLCLSTSAYVFIHHGWTSKAAKQLQQAIQLQTHANMYDPLLVESCQMLAGRFVDQQKFSKACQLLEAAQQYLKELKVISPIHQEAISQNKPAISEQLSQIRKQHTAQKICDVQKVFSSVGSVTRQRHEIVFHYHESCLDSLNKFAFKAFFAKNKIYAQKQHCKFSLPIQHLFASRFMREIDEITNILATPIATPITTSSIETQPDLVERLNLLLTLEAPKERSLVLTDEKLSPQLSALSLDSELSEFEVSHSPHSMTVALTESQSTEKLETIGTVLVEEASTACSTRKDSDEAESDKIEYSAKASSSSSQSIFSPSLKVEAENYGFEPIPGFAPIIPITSRRLAKHTLFITVQNTPNLAPFYKLFCDKKRENFYEVPEIPAKGLNKQGIKLGTLPAKTGKRGEKIAYGRLKVLGAQGTGKLRAQGFVEQTITLPNGKQRKLYVFRQAEPKKVEKRKNYRF